MSVDAWLTLAVVGATLIALARDVAPPPFILLAGVVVLLLTDVIGADQALAGFANPAPVTVAALYIVARAVQRTGVVNVAVERLLGAPAADGRPPGVSRSVIRLLAPVIGASAFLNNTPIVAMLAPNVVNWADSRGVAASKLLIPLSYGAIIGGIITAIGTSTTLVVSGLMEQAGMEPIGLLEPVALALPVTLATGLVIALGAAKLLPERRAAHEAFREGRKSFTLALSVADGGPVDGSNLTQAGLRALRGVYCVQVRRGDRVIAPVAPDVQLQGGDELTFVGDVHRVVDLQHRRGLSLAEAHHAAQVGSTAQQFFEAVIGPSSSLVGTTLKDVGFRAAYGAAVVAIHRAGEPIEEKLGEVPLRVGDTLLCLAAPGFSARAEATGAFVLVAAVGAEAPLDRRRQWTAMLTLVGMLVLATSGLLSILEASLAAAILLVATGVMTTNQARQAVDVPVIVVIAASFGLGAAADSSGLAAEIAQIVRTVFSPFGQAGLLVGVLVLVMVLTELITNNAAAVLAFPVAQAAAEQAGIDPRPLLIAIAIAASLSFLTPIGYQTNLMVYGLGGYRFTDFTRLGAPVALVALATLGSTLLLAV